MDPLRQCPGFQGSLRPQTINNKPGKDILPANMKVQNKNTIFISTVIYNITQGD